MFQKIWNYETFVTIFVSELIHEYMKQKNTDKPPATYDKVLIGALAETFEKSFITIERWIESKDDRLTSEKAKEVYKRYSALTKN
jgi:hypothetical protein